MEELGLFISSKASLSQTGIALPVVVAMISIRSPIRFLIAFDTIGGRPTFTIGGSVFPFSLAFFTFFKTLK